MLKSQINNEYGWYFDCNVQPEALPTCHLGHLRTKLNWKFYLIYTSLFDMLHTKWLNVKQRSEQPIIAQILDLIICDVNYKTFITGEITYIKKSNQVLS